MKAIYKREVASYFNTVIGFVFIAILVGFIGIYFLAYNLAGGYPYFSYSLGSVLFIFMLAIPILTMRSFSDERKSKTDQLLLTAPVGISSIVLGKYLAMITVFAIPVCISILCPIIIEFKGDGFLLVDMATIFAFFLLGSVYIAIGMFISSLTESQIISAVGTFGILLLLYLWPNLIEFLPATASMNMIGILCIITIVVCIIYAITKNWVVSVGLEVVCVLILVITYFVNQDMFEHRLSLIFSNISFIDTFESFAYNQIFDIGGIIYYLSIIGLFIYLTIQSIQKRRWS